MDNLLYLAITILLYISFLIYFRIARIFKIVDLPNHRTMHEGATIRGAGIVILIAIVVFSLFIRAPGYYVLAGMVLVGITGFLDDLIDLSGKVRIPFQMLSILLIIAELDLLGSSLLLLLLILIVATGILNAFNFMDGINGMTGGYSLVIIASLTYVNNTIFTFIPNSFLVFILLSLIVFSFFNFRNKALCFAGDVGSLTIAYIIVYLIIKLIHETQEITYLLFLTLYGIDTIFTIIQRLILKENIFEAHRLHFFQVAVSKTGMPHLYMSIIYMVIQAIVNLVVILMVPLSFVQQMVYSVIMLLFLSIVYIALKRRMVLKAL